MADLYAAHVECCSNADATTTAVRTPHASSYRLRHSRRRDKTSNYTGRLEESARLFYDQIEQYFTARGISWLEDSISGQIIAILARGLQGPAAQWSSIKRHDINSVHNFFTQLAREFVPADFQQRLRNDLHSLKQSNCNNLADYVARFRQVMVQITDMSEIYKIIYF